jgi:D-alanyl-lipoteichoic acid acyltransferase DltB (MBOAT superfamily)
MIFTSFAYAIFLALVVTVYWALRQRQAQNLFLLAASYVFYGWVTPWFCLLIAAATVTAYGCCRGMAAFPAQRKRFLLISLCVNLGLLALFKYFNFFIENVQLLLDALGLGIQPAALRLALPAGISFYTFQLVGCCVDVYRGQTQARKNFADFALFASFFPLLLSGPIERANSLLPQIEQDRRWSWDVFNAAWLLLLAGLFKKLVIADNLAFYADKVFMLENPGPLLLLVGTFAFSVQIYADFSGYTDLARGSARLLGFELTSNFNFPYFAVSPSDFWRRWHISLSTWIRDYIYIPLGGSRQNSRLGYAAAILATMSLCGLWHGAAWTFVLWGLYHGVASFVYALLGFGGRWRPAGKTGAAAAWLLMFAIIQFGWLIFRAPSLSWLAAALWTPASVTAEMRVVAAVIAVHCAFHLLQLGLLALAEKKFPSLLRSPVYALLLLLTVLLHSETGQDFIYFQF